MARLTLSLPIERPAADVFDFITDLDRMHLWSARLTETETLHAEPEGVGTRVRQVYAESGRPITTEGEVTRFDRPSLYALRYRGGKYEMTVEYAIESTGTGAVRFMQTTRLVQAWPLKPLVELLFALTAGKRMKRDLHMLKRLLEAETEPTKKETT